ncbi:2-nitropropane dioxygenase [Ceratobasidium theobromae]|uniref:2-nitropropane dioxygenase n=1 Tax=Ceratobasidium theobromae TaxID=1582974 RepID=A0A5N5QEP1_9AGAM|nr:2-nitropropane dioxygenase [Ceratobasidium theobromae]
MPKGPINTTLTETFGIQHPIMLAGMNVAAGPKLAAAVTNAGGLGVIGGLGYTPKVLRQQIHEIKEQLSDKNAPFGVDLLLPQVGGSARKTNYDYTKGQLPQLLDVIIEEKTALFVCAVGVPPKSAVEKLHKAGIPIMNMVGHPKHVAKALAAGVDIICAQGGEGGGHTGHVPTSILIPACVDAVKGHKSPLTGKPVFVVAAGGIYDGRGLAAALMWGAQGVWVGTRFVASEEAGAPKMHKDLLLKSEHEDIMRTLIFTGRPLNVYITDYIKEWETKRQGEIAELTSKGIIPHEHELEKHPEKSLAGRRFLMGNVAAVIKDVLPARTIVDNMVAEAVECINRGGTMIGGRAKL